VKKLFRRVIIFVLVSSVLGISAIGITYLVLEPDLPDVETLRDVQLQVPLRVFSEDGKLLGIFGEKRRIPITVEEIPDYLKQAFLAGEDARFYEHPGIDYQGITRAVWSLATTGEKTIGGSTITQQLARNFFLTSEKTWTRKIKEAFLALKIEQKLNKDEILELYVNKIFLGHRAYGVGAAAEVYYGKSTNQLSLAQCAMIAALPKAPSRINPITSPERALERRDYVLDRMLQLGYIEKSEFDAAIREPDRAFYHGAIAEISASYVAEMVRVRSLRLLGSKAYTGGYVVRTTINSRLQTAANLAVSNGLEEYDQRHGFRGPEAHVDLADKITTAQWAEILLPHRPVSGLEPGLVVETEDDLALVYLRNGQTVALTLEDMKWAARFISRDRKGYAPKKVEDIMVPGDIIRARLHNDGTWKLGQLPEVEVRAAVTSRRWSGVTTLRAASTTGSRRAADSRARVSSHSFIPPHWKKGSRSPAWSMMRRSYLRTQSWKEPGNHRISARSFMAPRGCEKQWSTPATWYPSGFCVKLGLNTPETTLSDSVSTAPRCPPTFPWRWAAPR